LIGQQTPPVKWFIPLLIATRGHIPERDSLALASDGYLWDTGGGGIVHAPSRPVRRRPRERDELLEQRLQEDETILAIIISAVTRDML
jgi:hypothetical protein